MGCLYDPGLRNLSHFEPTKLSAYLKRTKYLRTRQKRALTAGLIQSLLLWRALNPRRCRSRSGCGRQPGRRRMPFLPSSQFLLDGPTQWLDVTGTYVNNIQLDYGKTVFSFLIRKRPKTQSNCARDADQLFDGATFHNAPGCGRVPHASRPMSLLGMSTKE